MFRLWDERRENAPARPTAKPTLEIVEERILLSVVNVNPLTSVAVASPPAAPSVAAVVSYVESAMDQVMAAAQQEVRALVTIIVQEQAYLIQEVKDFLGIYTPANPTLGTSAQQSGNGSGATTIQSPTPQPPRGTISVGRGSGSGSALTGHGHNPTHGVSKIEPMDGGGGGGGGSGSMATFSGKVWLDNDGDGFLDNGELGYSGDTVTLCDKSGQPIAGVPPTTTDGGGNFNFTFAPVAAPNNYYEVLVGFPPGDTATIPDYDSEINAQGYSAAFQLAAGGLVDILAGLRSMRVTTVADDPNNNPIQNQITLRDAIKTGNNGPPFAAVTFGFKQGQGGPTITLQDELPAIATSYDIDGPGASNLTVKGAGQSPVFTVNSGVTSIISGLSITGGFGGIGGGGGVNNFGNLSLSSDCITGNKTFGNGGGVYNAPNATLTVAGCTVANNDAQNAGGGIANNGELYLISLSEINVNEANEGGGLSNSGTGNVIMLGSCSISGNTAGKGGGIYNSGSGSMTNAEITDNKALDSSGGGIYCVSMGTLTLKNGTTITKNTAQSQGGGLFLETGVVKMSGGAISSNQAIAAGSSGVGGGIYVYSGSLTLSEGVQIFHNTSLGAGAGMAINGGSVIISGGAIEYNAVHNPLNGGGIYNAGGTLTLQGGVYIGPENSAKQGGGMYLANGSTTTFNVVTVAGNVADLGVGVYQQKPTAKVTQPINLTDKDDPGGKPFQGS